MSFTIEQDREQAKRAFSLQSRADIISIRLVDGRISCKVRIEEAQVPLRFAIRFEPEDAILSEGQLTATVKFVFKTSDKNTRDALVIRCRIQADYRLMEGFRPSEEEIEAFNGGNAILNCWPYFREFVQSTVTRMHYPPPTIPFLRLVPKRTGPRAELTEDLRGD
jgi:hypothetical protein